MNHVHSAHHPGDALLARGWAIHRHTTAAERAPVITFFPGEADSYVDLGDPTELQITGAMTLTAWVVVNGSNQNSGRIISKEIICFSATIKNKNAECRQTFKTLDSRFITQIPGYPPA